MVSAAVACLPAAVSLLLLKVLFMQISGVSLVLTWPCRLCLFRVLLCGSLCYKLSPFQALGKVTLHLHCQACMFIYSLCGKWVFSPLLWSFPPSATLTSFPTPGCWAHALPLLPPEPLWPTQLVYLQSREGFPSPNLRCSVHPTLFLACLICSYCLLLSFSFPRVEVSLSRGLCFSHPGFSLGVPWHHKAHLVHVFTSRLGTGDWRPGGPLCWLEVWGGQSYASSQ
jgi:hypothetical protein